MAEVFHELPRRVDGRGSSYHYYALLPNIKLRTSKTIET